MTKVIIYTGLDGRISVCHPCATSGVAEAVALQHALLWDIPSSARQIKVIEKSVLPADRTFRDAWRQMGGGVGVDMASARNIHLARLRAERNERLHDTDWLIARATEQGRADEVAALTDYRQALRDMPQRIALEIEAAATPDQLKVIRPAPLEQIQFGASARST